jgi:RNA polymerase sigma-70 factor (ECF subfamily)
MDNHDDQQDLFQEIVCQLWKSYDSFKTKVNFLPGCTVAINTAIVLKKEKRKVDKYEIVSENIKEETDDSELKKVK